MAHDIFISYSSKDKQTADAICHVLESNKLKCWIAPRNIIAGKNYAEQIMYGLKNAKIVVLVFSKIHRNLFLLIMKLTLPFLITNQSYLLKLMKLYLKIKWVSF